MGELKSAWEIAQERANRLGKLSAEELELQQTQECRQIGQALAQKWLDSSGQLDITGELGKHEEKAKKIIKQALIEHLVEAIGFTSARGTDRVKGIITMVSNLQPELKPKTQEIHELIEEYEAAEQKTRQELESKHREILHQLRISGTAVDAVNVEAAQEWQSARRTLIEALTPRLNDLKQTLVKLVSQESRQHITERRAPDAACKFLACGRRRCVG